VMVMRGDGGATDLAGFMNAPTRTLYSGPAASVAGALRSGGIENAVIVEVGGTSTNVAAIRRGRPMLSYVQVASHATAIRALDVRVLGVAGGSMLRARRGRVYGVGPRSAHIAALPYACFLAPAALADATAAMAAPRSGDPADYVVLHLADGGRAALTNTCAANALGIVEAGDYAEGDRDAARAGFAAAGALLGLDGDEVARRMLQASTQAVGDLVATVIHEHRLERPLIVAVGGGAGGLGRAVASAMELEISVPAHAEVISALGDALSLIRAERERTFARPTPADTQHLIGEVESEAIAAGASASSLDVRVEHITDRSAVRVTVSGAVGLLAGALPGRRPATQEEAEMAARERGCPGARAVGQFWVTDDAEGGRVVVFDRYADVIVDVRGETVDSGAEPPEAAMREALARQTRHRGPIEIVPDAWVLSGSRFLQVPAPDVASIMETAAALGSHHEATTVVVGRD
jgi:N-methylhydantoinase A